MAIFKGFLSKNLERPVPGLFYRYLLSEKAQHRPYITGSYIRNR